MNLFELKDVTYKNILKIDHIAIKNHEVTAIIGESGAGKTTFLRLLNKMISPSGGTIHFKGKSLDEVESIPHRKNVPLLRQKPFLFASTILDNFKRIASIHGLEIDESHIEKLLKKVHVNKPLNTLVKTLSGGEAQRVAIARIMFIDAEVILLDEPSSALDDETEEAIIKEIVSYVKSMKKALIMVTHSTHIAKRFADSVLVIKNQTIKEALHD